MGLCDDCKVLELDEKDHGGYSKENEEGDEVLWFDVDTQRAAESREVKKLHLKYRRVVTFAELESMVGVCEFCSLIWQEFLRWFPTHKRFKLRELWYEWEGGCLERLILGFWVSGESESGNEPVNESFVEQKESCSGDDKDDHRHFKFDVFAEPGTPTHSNLENQLTEKRKVIVPDGWAYKRGRSPKIFCHPKEQFRR